MFLLLMPIFAAPLEAFAAFGELLYPCLEVKADLSVFMSAGVPMYYLTARSREHSRNRTTDSGGGMSATIARKSDQILVRIC